MKNIHVFIESRLDFFCEYTSQFFRIVRYTLMEIYSGRCYYIAFWTYVFTTKIFMQWLHDISLKYWSLYCQKLATCILCHMGNFPEISYTNIFVHAAFLKKTLLHKKVFCYDSSTSFVFNSSHIIKGNLFCFKSIS